MKLREKLVEIEVASWIVVTINVSYHMVLNGNIQFETKCIGCSRYKRNCSILQKAKEGRVQDEIINCNCIKYKK